MTSLFVGSVGAGFFLYGKKQSRLPQLLVGILIALDSALMPDALWMCVAALGVVGALWFALRQGF